MVEMTHLARTITPSRGENPGGDDENCEDDEDVKNVEGGGEDEDGGGFQKKTESLDKSSINIDIITVFFGA